MNQIIPIIAIIVFSYGVYTLHNDIKEANKHVQNVIKAVNSL